MLKFLKKDFKHVYAVKESPGKKFWLIVDPMVSHTGVDLKAKTQYCDIKMFMKKNDKCIKIVSKITPGQERWSFCVINCVEIVKSLIGLRSFWTMTPYQLYKKLKRGSKHGA